MAVGLKAAHASYNLYVEAERSWKSEMPVLIGCYNLQTQHVSMPPASFRPAHEDIERPVDLAYAATHPRVFDAMSIEMAELLVPDTARRLCDADDPAKPDLVAS